MNENLVKKQIIDLYYNGEYEKSFDCAKKSYEALKDKFYLEMAIKNLKSKGDKKGLSKFLKNCLKSKTTDDINQLSLLGFEFYLQKDYKNSAECYKKILEIEPNSAKNNFNVASAYHSMKKFKEAKKYYRLALKADNYHVNSLNNLAGIYYLQDKNYKWGESLYKSVLNIERRNPEALHHLGIIQKEFHKDFEMAYYYVNLAAIIDPDYFYNHYQLALISKKLGREEKFQKELSECKRLKPNSIEVKYLLTLQ